MNQDARPRGLTGHLGCASKFKSEIAPTELSFVLSLSELWEQWKGLVLRLDRISQVRRPSEAAAEAPAACGRGGVASAAWFPLLGGPSATVPCGAWNLSCRVGRGGATLR